MTSSSSLSAAAAPCSVVPQGVMVAGEVHRRLKSDDFFCSQAFERGIGRSFGDEQPQGQPAPKAYLRIFLYFSLLIFLNFLLNYGGNLLYFTIEKRKEWTKWRQ